MIFERGSRNAERKSEVTVLRMQSNRSQNPALRSLRLIPSSCQGKTEIVFVQTLLYNPHHT
jgi:hypothetical protein